MRDLKWPRPEMGPAEEGPNGWKIRAIKGPVVLHEERPWHAQATKTEDGVQRLIMSRHLATPEEAIDDCLASVHAEEGLPYAKRFAQPWDDLDIVTIEGPTGWTVEVTRTVEGERVTETVTCETVEEAAEAIVRARGIE